ncbi:MAG: hypothetical protein RSA41_07080 [Christensenella sp.]
MKKFESFDTAQAPQEAAERLPAGGYILKILDAEEATFSNGGQALRISFDITEGEYKDFYKNNYATQKKEDKKWKGVYTAYIPKEDGTEQDAWTASAFKGMTEAVENSNKGFHWDWDEKKLKNKTVGGMFGNKEYSFNGHEGFYTDCRFFTDVEKIRSGKLKPVKDKLLNKNGKKAEELTDFEPMDEDAELPF